MTGMENKQPVSTKSSVSAAPLALSVDDPTRGRPKCRSTTGTGNSFDSGNSSS